MLSSSQNGNDVLINSTCCSKPVLLLKRKLDDGLYCQAKAPKIHNRSDSFNIFQLFQYNSHTIVKKRPKCMLLYAASPPVIHHSEITFVVFIFKGYHDCVRTKDIWYQ